MKRSSYRGEHKGSTLKARSKIFGMRVLNVALSIVLVVGLAPSVSFAGDLQQSESSASAEAQQPVEQQQTQQSDQSASAASQESAASQQAADASGNSAKAEGKDGQQGKEEPSLGAAQATDKDAEGKDKEEPALKAAQNEITVSYGPPEGAVLFENVYYTKSGGTFNITVAGAPEGAVVEAKVDTESPVAADADKYPVSVPANGEAAETSHTISVTIKASDAADADVLHSESKTVIVDNKPPSKPAVTWAADPNVGSIGDGNSITYYATSSEITPVTTATVTVNEQYLPTDAPTSVEIDSQDGFETGKTASTIAVMAGNTTPTITGWTAGKSANEWQTTVSFSGAATGQLSIVAVDKAGNVSDPYKESNAKTITVTADEVSPTLSMSYDPAGTDVGGVKYYSKTATKFKASATIGEANPGGSFVGTLNGIEKFKSETAPYSGEIEQSIETDHSTDNSYTITVSGKDRAGHDLTGDGVTSGVYTQNIVVDTIDPKITIGYTDIEGNSQTLAGTDPVFAKYDGANTKATVTVSDTNFDAANTKIYLNDSTTAESMTMSSGTAAEINLAAGENEVSTTKITVVATDLAGNSVTQTGTLKVDRQAPAIAIALSPESGVEYEPDNTVYYASRTATITVTADDLDLTDLNDTSKNYVTATVGWSSTGKPVEAADDNTGVVALTWKAVDGQANTFTTTAPISFSNNATGCTLTVAASDKHGNSSNATTATEEEPSFSILSHPLVSVSLSPTPAENALGLPGKKYTRGENGALTATVKIKDLNATTNIASITASRTNPNVAPSITWDESSGIERTGTVLFTDDTTADKTTTLTINVPDTYVGVGSTAAGGITIDGGVSTDITAGGLWQLADIIIDKTPPVLLAIGFGSANVGTAGDKLYFNAGATATVELTEANLSTIAQNLGKNMELTVTRTSTHETAFTSPDYAFSRKDASTFEINGGVTFPVVAGEVAEYNLTIQGSDILSNALEKTGDESAYITDGVYSRNIVIDNAAPQLSVTYGSGVAYDTNLVNGQDVTVTVSVAESLFATDGQALTGLTIVDTAVDKDNNRVTDTTIVPTNIEITPDTENHTYNATFTLGGTSSGTITHTLVITGKDVAGNKMALAENGVKIGTETATVGALNATGEAGVYTATIKVDQITPKLEVTSSPAAPAPITVGNVPTYYFNTAPTITGTATDETYILATNESDAADHGMSSEFGAVASVTKDYSTAGTTFNAFGASGYTVPSTDGTYTFMVTGKDAAGNALAPKAGDANLANAQDAMPNETFRANVVLDTKKPGVAVTYQVGTAEAQDLTYNTSATVGNTAKITATFNDGGGSGMDRANTTFKYKPGDGTEVTVSGNDLHWETGTDTVWFNVPVVQGETVSNAITIDGQDLAGNKLVGSSTTAVSGGTAVAYTATLIIDNTPPKLSVTYNKGAADAFENVTQGHSATEKRYYQATVTPTIVVVEDSWDPTKVSINGTPTEAGQWNTVDNTHTYIGAITYTANTSTALTITGTDAYDNKFIDGNEATFIDGNGLYKSTIVVDNTPPTVEVKYSKNSTPAEEDPVLANNGSTISGSNLYVFVTVTDALSFDESRMSSDYKIEAGPSAKIQKDGDNVWRPQGDGKYMAVLLLDAEDETNPTYTVTASGKDLAGNDLASYSATAEIDKVAPKLSVSYTPAPVDITGEGKPGEMRYYGANTAVTATVRVTEKSHEITDLSKLQFSVDPTAGAVLTPLAEVTSTGDDHVYEGTVVLNARTKADGNETYTISVSGEDNYGNKLKADPEQDKKPYVSSTGAYSSKVRFDVVEPELTIEWTPSDAVNNKYFNTNRTATVKVKEESFDPKRITFSKNGGAASSYDGWSQNGDEWVLNLDGKLNFTNADEDQQLVINGADLAGNLMKLVSDNASPTPGTATGGVYTSAPFVIDTDAPTVKMRVNQKRSNYFNGKDYFNSAMYLDVAVNVEDAHFDYATNTQFKKEMDDGFAPTPEASVRDKGTWNGSSRTVSFRENSAVTSLESDLSVVIYDLAGNRTDYTYGQGEGTTDGDNNKLTGGSFVLDVTAPTIAGMSNGNIPDSAYTGKTDDSALLFYQDPAVLTIVAKDDLGVFATAGRGGDGAYTFDEGEGVQGAVERAQHITLQEGHEFRRAFEFYVQDVAGNYRGWSINPQTSTIKTLTPADMANAPLYTSESSMYPEALILDRTAPEILDLSGATAGEFYADDVSIHASLRELNFSYMQAYAQYSGQPVVTINKEPGKEGDSSDVITIPVSAFNPEGEDNVYGASQQLGEGHYTVVAQLTDPAGNTSNPPSTIDRFTVDKTDPVIQEITFDNNAATNGKYYKSGRTATITIIEHNWDPGRVTITTNGSIGGWSDNGDTHTCTVTFSSDGTYNLSVSCTDRAGRSAAPQQVEEFVIDQTAPSIEFSNVVAQTAYGDVIEPTINYHDEANFDPNGMQWTLTGNKNGGQTFAAGQSSSGNDGTVTFSDFPRQVEADDIYTLQAHLTDMAGNEADNSISFSVNRFGSNFIVLDQDKFDSGVLDEPIEVRVQEINVSGAKPAADGKDSQAVTVTKDLTTSNLKKRDTPGNATTEGFYVESGSESTGWSSYIYHIGTDNFARRDKATGEIVKKDGKAQYDDGSYHVVITSRDTAENLNNSASYYNPDQHKTTTAEVSFLLDSAAPVIDNVNLVSGGTYDANAMEALSFIATDNTGTPTVTVEIDGQSAPVTVGMGGACTVDLPIKAWTGQKIVITATDDANLSTSVTLENVHWTTDFLELNLFLVIGGVVIVGALAAGGVVFVRRRNGL